MNLKLSFLCLSIYCVTLSDAMTIGDQIKEAFIGIVIDSESFLRADDHGTVINCGSTNMSLTWTPKILDPKRTLTIEGYAKFPAEFESGTLVIEVKYLFIQRTIKLPVTCSMMQDYGVPVKCPVKQNQMVQGQFTIKDLSALQYLHGTIEVKIFLFNSHMTQLFCGSVTAEVN
ncbi:hypothetical protein ACJMK2_010313 [Sinanodonta woodiana]|uniref:MD-2-related lipid-recognition domain-containing protein n=1 Tax=Sinanodonta woodiana TaxID=1069815 RepID=A0ABD3VEY3_SINWO